MSAERSAVERPFDEGAGASIGPRSIVLAIAKNVFVLAVVLGLIAAHETGYFSRDRIARADWMALYDPPKDRPSTVAYEAAFTPDFMKRENDAGGAWAPYNGALPETISTDGRELVVKYSLAWLGVRFEHKAFQPKALYRLRFEAKVDGEPAAVLMRNRQLDYMRELLPTTGGEFKEFTALYAAPAGRYDRVNIIFMPDGRGQVSGALTIRKFRIERLEK